MYFFVDIFIKIIAQIADEGEFKDVNPSLSESKQVSILSFLIKKWYFKKKQV